MTLTMLEWLQRRLNIINDTGLMSLGVAIRGTFRGGAKGALFLVFVECFCNQQQQSV